MKRLSHVGGSPSTVQKHSLCPNLPRSAVSLSPLLTLSAIPLRPSGEGRKSPGERRENQIHGRAPLTFSRFRILSPDGRRRVS